MSENARLILFFYPFFGLIVGVVSFGTAFEDAEWCPEGTALAAAVLAALLWPLTLLAAIVLLVWRGSRAIARSFAVLWDYTGGAALDSWHDRRERRRLLPRAAARRKDGWR
jgi:hypothetical protein